MSSQQTVLQQVNQRFLTKHSQVLQDWSPDLQVIMADRIPGKLNGSIEVVNKQEMSSHVFGAKKVSEVYKRWPYTWKNLLDVVWQACNMRLLLFLPTQPMPWARTAAITTGILLERTPELQLQSPPLLTSLLLLPQLHPLHLHPKNQWVMQFLPRTMFPSHENWLEDKTFGWEEELSKQDRFWSVSVSISVCLSSFCCPILWCFRSCFRSRVEPLSDSRFSAPLLFSLETKLVLNRHVVRTVLQDPRRNDPSYEGDSTLHQHHQSRTNHILEDSWRQISSSSSQCCSHLQSLWWGLWIP